MKKKALSILLSILLIMSTFTMVDFSASAATNTYQVSCSAGVKLRSDHSTSSTQLTSMANGTSFTVTEKYMAGGYYWGKTTYSGKTGWTALAKTDYSEVYSTATSYTNNLHVWVGDANGNTISGNYLSGSTYYFHAEVTDPLFTSQKVYVTNSFAEKTCNLNFKVVDPSGAEFTTTRNNSSKSSYGITGYKSGTYKCTVTVSGSFGNTVSVSYSINSNTVYFNANGGSVGTSSTTVINGSTYGTLPTPTRTGYTFAGWYTSSSGGTQITSTSTANLSGSQTLYAHWSSDPTFSTISLNSTKTVNISSAGQIMKYEFTPTESGTYYFFSESDTDTYGYLYNSSLGEITHDDDSSVNRNFKISYNLTAGTKYYFGAKLYSSSSSSGSFNVKLVKAETTLPTVSISSTNNVASSQIATLNFSDSSGIVAYYWGTNSSYSNNAQTETYASSDTVTVSSPGTYHLAAMDICGNTNSTSVTYYQTSFNANGGSVSTSSVLTKSGNSFIPPVPTKSGYVFNGWSTSSTATSGTKSSIAPTSNTTYYATWKSEESISLNTVKNVNITTAGDVQYFSFTPSESGKYYFFSEGDVDTFGYLYNSSLSAITDNDDAGAGRNFLISYNLTANTKYYFATKLYNSSSTGNYTIKLVKAETTAPSIQYSGTNNTSSSQRLTISVSDSSGLLKYYWGTNETYSSNLETETYKSPIEITVDQAGTYYFTIEDVCGNRRTTDFTFYNTSFNANGGTVSTESILTRSGYSLSAPTPTRDGYMFNGWSTSSSATSGTKSSITPTSNTTYYATWLKGKTISLNTVENVNISTAGEKIYYKFIPSTSGTYYFYSKGSADSYGYIYDSSMTELSSNDDNDVDYNFNTSYNLTAGNTYYLCAKMHGSTSTGNFKVKVIKAKTTKPTISFETTNTLSEFQTATFTVSEDSDVYAYRWGTIRDVKKAKVTDNTIVKPIYSSGTYYFIAEDVCGNTNEIAVTYYETVFVDNYGVTNARTILTNSGYSFTPPTPTRTGWTFNGWSTSSSATSGTKSSMTPTSNVTYYATWTHTHNYTSSVTSSATCTSTGVRTYTCSICNDSYTETISKLAHSWNNGTITKQPTCSAKGVKTFTCTVCSTTKTEDIAIVSTAHNWNSGTITKQPTCSEKGVKTYTCTLCSTTKTEDVAIVSTAHNWNSGTITKQPTCSAKGVKTYTCTLCNGTKTEDVAIVSTAHNWNSGTVTKTATCSAKGVKTYTCTLCSTTKTEEIAINSTAHNWNSGTVTKQANCTEKGVKTFTCTLCQKTKTEDIAIDSSAHNYSTSTVTKPTCTAQGYTTHTCSRCNNSYKDTYTSALGHNWNSGSITKQPTCSAKGVKTYTCTRCNGTKTEDVAINPDAHNYTTIVTNPTCTAQGYTTHTCSRCNNSYKDTYTSALGHSWNNGSITKQPTCSAKGVKTYTCTRCNGTKTEDVAIVSTAHNWNSGTVTKAATCTTKGVKTFTCTLCKTTRTEDIAINPNAHNYTTTVTNPTCALQGYTTHTCTLCSNTFKDTYTDATRNHTWNSGTITKQPTCTEEGEKTYTCSVCKSTKNESVSANGHSWNSGTILKNPTCVYDGEKVVTCTVCRITKNQTINATGHNYSTKTITPTCTTQGYTKNTCLNCGNTYNNNYKEELGHNWGSGTVTKQATCTSTGSKKFTCSRCSETKTDTVPINSSNHNYSSSKVVAPTCTTQGYTSHLCSLCGKTVKDTYVKEKGHQYKSKTLKQATCTEDGKKRYTCTVCDYYYDASISATGHNYSSKNVAATCTAQGYTEHNCANCGNVYKNNYTSKIEHTYVNSLTKATTTKNGKKVTKCSVCGSVKSSTTIYYPKTIKLSATSYVYSGSVKTPTVKVVDSNNKTITSDNYTVKYQTGRKAIGKYTVTITFKGNYSGKVTKSFTIVPKATKFTTAKSPSKSTIVLAWSTVSGITGYQVQTATNSGFSKNKKTYEAKPTSKDAEISKLDSKKTYYIRIRTYKTVNGTKYYSKWYTTSVTTK